MNNPYIQSQDKINWKQYLLLLFLPINFLFDFFSVFYTSGRGQSEIALLRGLIILILFFTMIPNTNFKSLITKSIWIFIIYISILIPFASDIQYSINVSTKVFTSLLCFTLSYRYINSELSMKVFCKSIFFLYLILFLSLILNNYFNLGGGLYSKEIDFQAGGYTDDWNVLTYLLLISPLYYTFESNILKKRLFSLFFISTLIILIISFKRIAIGGVIFGFLVFSYHYNKKKIFKNFILIIIALSLLLPFYSIILKSQYFAREDRFRKGAFEEEARYLESIYIWDEILSFNNIKKSMFGMEAFNSVGKYANNYFNKRQAHIDYNLIVISNGIIGLLLYLSIYFSIFNNRRKLLLKPNNLKIKILNGTFWSLFYTSLFTSFGGQMYSITFRSIIFLFMGSILRYLRNTSNER